MNNVIRIDVEATWEKFDDCKRKNASGYSGGFETKAKGYRQINLGFGTPDFGRYTIQDIKNMIMRQYASWFPDKKLDIRVKVVKDERVIESLEGFF